MRKLLFVINTLGRAGAETALLDLLRRLDPDAYDVSLFVLTGQGEMVFQLPPRLRLLNTGFAGVSVLDGAGRRRLAGRVCRCLAARGTGLRLLPYMLRNLWDMLRRGRFDIEKLLWRVLSDGAPRWDTTYDLAVAYLEGGSTYYVADHVNAKKKAAFLHIDYTAAGYTRKLDLDCYAKMDLIFAVGPSARESFLSVYPEHGARLRMLPLAPDVAGVLQKARLPGGFTDGYRGVRLLSVGRLTAQKAFDVAVRAMRLLRDAGTDCRWYVLGEGPQRRRLARLIRALGLEDDFILCGAVDEPYPYFAQADLYVHASRFEGRSIALLEAQALGCPVLATDCPANRDALRDGVDGRLCPLTPQGIRDGVLWLLAHPAQRAQYAQTAAQKQRRQTDDGTRWLSAMLQESGD